MASNKRTTGRRDNKTGSIYRDGSGYRVQVQLGYDPANGKPIVKKCRAKTHEEAVEALAKLQQSNRNGQLAAPTGLTLGKYLEHWLENKIKATRSPNTYRQYKCVLETHVIPTLGKKPLDKVRRPDVQQLVAALTKQPVKPKSKPKEDKKGTSETETPETPIVETPKVVRTLGRRTIEVAVQRLHTAYEDAIRDGLAGINPAAYISLPQANRKPPQFLSPEQVVALNSNLEDSPVKELVRFMLATGARLGEATGLRWEDLDLKGGFVRIGGQLQRVNGKLEYRPTTKTNQDRMLTISKWLADQLKELKAKQLVNGHSDSEGIVFLNQFGRRSDPKYVYAELAAACVLAKIPPVSPHKLRHTAATLALMETGDLHGVQKLLGHQQVALTANLYGHATAERTRTITDALGKLLGPAQA